MRIFTSAFTLFVIAMTMLAGCSSSTTHGTIQGTVTLDGTALDDGVVRFVPVDGASQTASVNVVAGEFKAVVPIGKTRVEFSAPKVIGRQKMYETADSPEVDVVGELLPARYNVQSQLTLDVAAGSQPYALELFSK